MKSLLSKFWRVVALGLIGSVAILFFFSLWFWNHLEPGQREAIRGIIRHHGDYLLIPFFLLIVVLLWAIESLFSNYVKPIKRISEEVILINSANPSYRIEGRGSEEIRLLCDSINFGADRVEEIVRNVEDRIRQTCEEAEAEKNVLAAIISEFPQGVVACNMEGRILLYNNRAQEILGYSSHRGTQQEIDGNETERAGYLGLGRSIFGIIDRELIEEALRKVQEHVKDSGSGGEPALLVSLGKGRFLKVEMVPMLKDRKKLSGFVLFLKDVGQRSDTGRGAPWPLIPVPLKEAVDSLAKRAREIMGLSVSVDELTEGLWIKADTHSLVLALLFLLQILYTYSGQKAFLCRISVAGSFNVLDFSWQGPSPDSKSLEKWQGEKLSVQDESLSFSLGEVLAFHGVIIEAMEAEGPQCSSHLRLMIPALRGQEVGQRRNMGIRLESRPEFYDFNLFTHTELSEDLENRPLRELSYTVFDMETTGLDPNGGDEIIAISAFRIVNGRLLHHERFDQLVDPRRSIPWESVRVHGITPDMVEGCPTIEEVLPWFYSFVEDTVLVAHNAAFDMRFLELKEDQAGIKFLNPVLDTLLLSAIVHPFHDEHSLETIAQRLGIHIAGRHTAAGDALATAEIFLKLLPLLADKGIYTLKEALEASKKTYFSRLEV